ncbi:MAG TPA: hypothetical protein PK794_02150 [Armatimonadota bacterium]|nr:hypothetical protein [Armatimonadota bacterium]
MDAMLIAAYWICLAVGVGYTILAFILGEFSAAGHAGDASGDFTHEYGVGGAGGHGEATGVDGGGTTLLFGPFSPMVIAFFLTAFGASGLILNTLIGEFWPKTWPPLSPAWPLMMAIGLGFVLAWLIVLFFNRVIANFQSSSEVRLHTLIGTEAEVTVAIPATGTGEVAYVAGGSRNLTPASSADHEAIPRFATVRIVRIVGNLFQVKPVAAETLPELDEPAPSAAGPPAEA